MPRQKREDIRDELVIDFVPLAAIYWVGLLLMLLGHAMLTSD
jgi:hypothetical protein